MSDLSSTQNNKSFSGTRTLARALSAFFILTFTVAQTNALPDFMSGNPPRAQQTAPQQQLPQAQTRSFTVTAAPLAQRPNLPTPTESFFLPEPAAAPIQRAAIPQAQPARANNSAPVYRLGAGDKLRMIVFGEEDLSAEYELDGTGNLSLPLIGQVRAGGQTVQALESNIKALYSDGYLVNPRISLEVINFRPFYIVGEVNAPGNYPYINGLTVLNAVAVAGGYSPRAKKDKIQLKRIYNGQEQTQTVTEATAVLPGDVIEVKERFF